jgi:hypothetical protein
MARAQRGAAERGKRVSADARRARRSFEGKWAREGDGRHRGRMKARID